MGNQKQKWTAEEEGALLAGVSKHGPGKWKNILKDPEFAPLLTHRSNIDLKDKWRNLSVSTAAPGSKEKIKNIKIKAIAATPVASIPNSAPPLAICYNESSDAVLDDSSQNAAEGKKENAPRYNAMIFEALSTIKDDNGSDANAIVNFIEQRHEVPPNFKRLMSSRLRRLVAQGKLEKVQNCYKIKKDSLLGAKPSAPKQKDVKPQQSLTSGLVIANESVKDAALNAAYRVAEAENKSYMAAEAVKDLEMTLKSLEKAYSMLQLINEINEKCSRGEIVLLA
ncbi:Telomere repeat-binding factor like [Quillaja saponaria]|uniref:MYB transcription factor n=1 Tax=Quillaja saponaria TaxID=32244 RepID=A0AAD7PDH7_QUISA|nr:Telomere repeat-binding factor like [Quillaja saponaria]